MTQATLDWTAASQSAWPVVVVGAGVDLSLFDLLSLRPTVQRVHVGYVGCHAAIHGLRVAQAFADADPNATAEAALLEQARIADRKIEPQVD